VVRHGTKSRVYKIHSHKSLLVHDLRTCGEEHERNSKMELSWFDGTVAILGWNSPIETGLHGTVGDRSVVPRESDESLGFGWTAPPSVCRCVGSLIACCVAARSGQPRCSWHCLPACFVSTHLRGRTPAGRSFYECKEDSRWTSKTN